LFLSGRQWRNKILDLIYIRDGKLKDDAKDGELVSNGKPKVTVIRSRYSLWGCALDHGWPFGLGDGLAGLFQRSIWPGNSHADQQFLQCLEQLGRGGLQVCFLIFIHCSALGHGTKKLSAQYCSLLKIIFGGWRLATDATFVSRHKGTYERHQLDEARSSLSSRCDGARIQSLGIRWGDGEMITRAEERERQQREREAMRQAIAAYTGPVTKCPPGRSSTNVLPRGRKSEQKKTPTAENTP
jgi:hypothetical protein